VALAGIIAELAAFTWLAAAGIDTLDRLGQSARLQPVVAAGLLVGAVLLARGTIRLGVQAVNTFAVDAKAGLGRPPIGLFVADSGKGLLLAAGYALPMTAAVAALMEAAPDLWWLWAWSLWFATFVARTWLRPVFETQLFHTASRTEDPLLVASLARLLQRCGLQLAEVRIIDASRRSRRANASVHGFGKAKRILLHDTLLTELSPAEVEAVVAHEAGHARRRHILRYVMGAGAAGLVAAIGLATAGPWLGTTTSVRLAMFVIALPFLGFFLRPLALWALRRWELEADEFAVSHVGADAMAGALTKLYAANASAPGSDPIYAMFYASHPEPAQRLERLSAPRPDCMASFSTNSP